MCIISVHSVKIVFVSAETEATSKSPLKLFYDDFDEIHFNIATYVVFA